MKITHVIPGLTLERGGPTTVVNALSRYQVDLGQQVTVATTDQGARSGETPIQLDDRVLVRSFPVVGSDRVAYSPRLAQALPELLADSDIVHVHSIFTFPVHAALRAADRVRRHVLLRPCGLLHPYSLRRSAMVKSAYLKIWGGWLRRVITAWHFTSDEESKCSWPLNGVRRFVIPNGIEVTPADCRREEARRAIDDRLMTLQQKPYLLFLGRIHPKKRLDLLMEAFLAGAPKNYALVIAGPDESCQLGDFLSKYSQKFGTSAERIIVAGAVSGNEKRNLLIGAELLVLPSEHENFGNVVLEALAANTPVLASPFVDVMSAVVAAGLGETAPLDLLTWTNWFRELDCRLPALRGAAQNSANWVHLHYSWKRIAEQLVGVYQQLATNENGPTN